MSENALKTVNNGPKGLTGNTLKVIAMISMIIDHIGFAIIIHLPGMNDPASALSGIYIMFRLIGRLAFPIYCFMLTEGIRHTKSPAKYAIRMLTFIPLSELPFDLAFYHTWFEWSHQNVYMTLTLGVCMLWGFVNIKKGLLDKIPDAAVRISAFLIPGAFFTWYIGSNFKKILDLTLKPAIVYPLSGIITIFILYGLYRYIAKNHNRESIRVFCLDTVLMSVTAFAAQMMKTDYAAAGIIAIALMYMYRSDPVRSMITGCVVLSVFSSALELFAFLNIPLIANYNGKRGKGNKYLFYIVYPAHLLILYLIALAMGLAMNPGVI